MTIIPRRIRGGNGKRGFGWRPSIPKGVKLKTVHDLMGNLKDSGQMVVTVIPDIIDPRANLPPVRDQGIQGCCTGFASSGAMTYQMMRQGINPSNGVIRSPAYTYALTRKNEGTFPGDVGASVSDTVETLMQEGSCPETDMPYDQNVCDVMPTPQAYVDGLQETLLQAYTINNNDLSLIDLALSNGFTVVIGISVYESFESSQDVPNPTGIIPMPATDANGNITETLLGGHCIEIVGKEPDPSNNQKRMYIIKNSWGPDWGDKGYCYLSEDYLSNPILASDMHVIQIVKTPASS